MKYLNETGLSYLWINKLKPKFTELTNKTDQLSNPNLLINGDFQVNQRGQSRYEISNAWTYTFDMWRGNGWMSIEKTENGLKIQNNSDVKSAQLLNQKLEKSKNGTFTISVKVISKSGKAIAKLESTNSLIGQIELSVGDNVLTVNAEDLLAVTIEVGGSTTYGDYVELEYIDLFEGSVAWKHQKEDYATALMRCQRYVVKLPVIFNGYTNGAGCIYFLSEKTTDMMTRPTVVFNNAVIYLQIEGNQYQFNVTSMSSNSVNNGEVYIGFDSQSTLNYKTVSGYFNQRVLLTCEPL